MKLLVAVPRYPWPPRRGDQLRTLQTVDCLAGEHRLTLLVPEPRPPQGPPPELGPDVEIVTYRRRGGVGSLAGLLRAALGASPLQSGLYHQPDLSRKLRQLAPAADLGILQLVRLALHREDFGSLPVLVDLIDSLSLNVAGRARLDRPWLRPALVVEARLLAAEERRLLGSAAAGVVVSERDRRELARRLSPEAAERLSVVPLWIEAPRQRPPAAAVEGPADRDHPVVVITGNLGYFVNVDAILWWLRQVWGKLSRRCPQLRLVVAGARPPARLRRMLTRAGAELWVSPPDLRAALAQATVALAPMRGGSGVPIKILEAWSEGVPVVASPWAASGTEGRPGEDFLVADSPEQWVEAILHLIADPEARARLAAAGSARLAAGYSRARVQERWLEAVQAAIRAP